MSNDVPAAPIGHDRPPESETGRAALVEQVAMDMWRSRDPDPWEEAGDYWQTRFRELAATAIDSVRRHDDAQR